MSKDKKELLRKLRGDIIVVSLVLIMAFLAFLIPCFMHAAQTASEVVILQDGEETGRYSLLENRTITVSFHDEGYNLILISEGKVSVTDADCPDKLCVKQRDISKNGESIICLPHKLVIMIESLEESDLDAVTN
ncbi:MAG: NusG domain II-containing protein [Suilimivivens sp.]